MNINKLSVVHNHFEKIYNYELSLLNEKPIEKEIIIESKIKLLIINFQALLLENNKYEESLNILIRLRKYIKYYLFYKNISYEDIMKKAAYKAYALIEIYVEQDKEYIDLNSLILNLLKFEKSILLKNINKNEIIDFEVLYLSIISINIFMKKDIEIKKIIEDLNE